MITNLATKAGLVGCEADSPGKTERPKLSLVAATMPSHDSSNREFVREHDPFAEDISLLRRVQLFSGLNEKELRSLRSVMEQCGLVKGETVSNEFAHSPAFYILTKGKVEFLAKDSSGREVKVGEAGPGDYFGELSILTNEPVPFVARATEEAETISLEPHEFDDFLHKHPDAALDVLKVVSQRIGQTERLMREATEKSLDHDKHETRTFGQRVADGVANRVGSWTFVLTQSALVAGWMIWNSVPGLPHFDTFPFILLNLGLSMQAAYTGPMLQMSANRQAKTDRIAAYVDHQVNLKTELATEALMKRIGALEKKIDDLRMNI